MGSRLRGRFLRGRRRAAIPWSSSLAPLLDVLFLLVIFLLVTANFDSRQVLEVELPEAKTAEAVPRIDAEHQRVIALHADGSLTFNGSPTTAAELIDELGARPQEDRLLPIAIQGDVGTWESDSTIQRCDTGTKNSIGS